MVKTLKHLKYKFVQLLNFLKRHVWNQVMVGRTGKVWHYLKILFRNKFCDYPRLAIIETGTSCNIRCATCPTPQYLIGRPPSIMQLDVFKDIVDKLREYTHLALLHSVGEPLLNPYLSSMIEYADKNNLYTFFSTNCTLLDEKKADEILRSGLDEIWLCLDGMTKETYEPFRAGANFETVIKNIRYFCNEKKRRKLIKPFVELQFIVTKLNQDQVPQVRVFAKELGVDRLHVKPLAISECAYPEPKRSELMERFLPTKENAKIRYLRDKEGAIRRKTLTRCETVKNQIWVFVDGRLALCCYDIRGEYSYGNLLERPFKEIWFDLAVVAKRRLAEKRGYPLCKKCESY
jgi:MoaA/NifB/PqqE/SkfB family radical SAM enzyme